MVLSEQDTSDTPKCGKNENPKEENIKNHEMKKERVEMMVRIRSPAAPILLLSKMPMNVKAKKKEL